MSLEFSKALRRRLDRDRRDLNRLQQQTAESRKQPTAEDMLHLLWTACAGKDGYNKATWQEIERQLRSAGVIE